LLFGESELRRQVLADDIAIEQSHRASAHFEELHEQCVCYRRFSSARQAGKEKCKTLFQSRLMRPAQLGRNFRKGEPIRDFFSLIEVAAQLRAGYRYNLGAFGYLIFG